MTVRLQRRRRLEELRNRAELAVYHELRPVMRDGVVRLRIAAAGAVMMACVFGLSGYWFGSTDGLYQDAENRAAHQVSIDPRISEDPGGKEYRALLGDYKRVLAENYSGKRPAVCDTRQTLADPNILSLCD